MNHQTRLDPDEAGNAHLHALLDRLDPKDRSKLIKLLTKQQQLRDKFHTYRELLMGARLRDQGFNVRYERKVENKTPDWTLVDKDTTLEILDVMTLHQRAEKDREIREGLQKPEAILEIPGTGELICSWGTWITIPPDHVYEKLSEKAGNYRQLARTHHLPFVIAVYDDWLASISADGMKYVLFDHRDGWFKENPDVSGVIHFKGASWTPFQFDYTVFRNPKATHQSTMLLAAC